MVNRKSPWTVAGVFLLLLGLVPGLTARNNGFRTTYLTFSQPVRLPGVSLGSGTYIFELADPTSGAGAVRVLSRDRKNAYFLGLTTPVERPRRLNHGIAAVSLGESTPGSAPPITAWWPMDASTGHAFIYD